MYSSDKHVSKAFTLVKRLRYRYKDDSERTLKLEKILWYSVPLVWDVSLWQDTSREYQKWRMRKYRTRKYIESIFNHNRDVRFVTFTFTDEVLAKTNEKTRHKYVQRFLEEHCMDYIANVDYGSKNGREHYHAVVGDSIRLSEWPYGRVDFRKAGQRDADKLRVSKYINKLSNHAGKETAGKCFHKRNTLQDVPKELLDFLPF